MIEIDGATTAGGGSRIPFDYCSASRVFGAEAMKLVLGFDGFVAPTRPVSASDSICVSNGEPAVRAVLRIESVGDSLIVHSRILAMTSSAFERFVLARSHSGWFVVERKVTKFVRS
jgi:hypothetical protein